MTTTVDTNVLLYASDEASALHGQAIELLAEWAAGPGLVYLFWPVVMGYLRIATHPAVFERPLSCSEALGNVHALMERRSVRTAGETEGFWQIYRETAATVAPVGNLVPDAHLVALMRQHAVSTIFSRDRDFRKFDGIRAKDPFT